MDSPNGDEQENNNYLYEDINERDSNSNTNTNTKTKNNNDIKSYKNILEVKKKYFEEDNNLIDYFLVVGENPEIFKNRFLYDFDSTDDINALLEPQIITKFPKMDKKYIVLENTILQQIFPHGFHSVKVPEKPDPEFYSIILDNQLCSVTYPHKYLACLLIYESLNDYNELNMKYKSVDILSNILLGKASKDNNNNKINDEHKKKFKNYYIPKCICIVSVYPYFKRFEEILRALYDLTISQKSENLYIDRIIEKLIVETPKLPRGYKKIEVKFPNKKIDLTQSMMNKMPGLSVNLKNLFKSLDIENIIEIFRYLLFETKMIFFSNKLYDLTNTIMSILTLITPFKYEFQVVSVLPKELYNFVESISPYIFGINESYSPDFFSKNKITLEDTTICLVDIDQNKYYIVSSNTKNEEYPEIPKHLKEKIEKEYNNYLQDLITKSTNKKLKKSETKEYSSINNEIQEDDQKYQQIFFEFMIFLLKDYPKFLSKDYSVTEDISMSLKDMININAYLNSLSSNEKEFYKRIFSTQMFIDFIYKRMMPKNCSEKVEILFFEEKINEKILGKKLFGKSKIKEQNVLLSSDEYKYDNEIITIDCESEIGITDSVYEYILKNEKKAQIEFINKGYDIEIDKNHNKILFKYHIFPSLLSDQFFELNYKYYTVPQPFYKKIDLINNAIVNKSHLKFNKKELKISEIENDLYLCYLIIWSLTLEYTDKCEREYNFLKMIEIIEKVERHEIEIFELLFKAIVGNCDDKDAIILYKKFIHLNLNPSWTIFSLVSKIIKKKSNIQIKQKLLSQETKYKFLNDKRQTNKNDKSPNNIDNYRSRTLKTKKFDDDILFEDVIFKAYDKCKSCDVNIDLMAFCSNLSIPKVKTNQGKDYFKCPLRSSKNNNCNDLLLKIDFYFGVELFNKNSTSSTSKHYEIELLSPSTIKNKLLEISRELGDNKFDVEMFKINYKQIFWNLVWFFLLNNIDISFMLPYCYKSSNTIDDIQSKEIKQNVTIRTKITQDNELETISKNEDLNVDIDFYGNKDSLNLGDKNEKEEINKNIFTSTKKKYLMNDLVVQKIYQIYFSDRTGMVSYMGFETFSKNIGYNEYPVKFEEPIKTPQIHNLSSTVLSESNNSKDLDFFQLNSVSSSSVNIIDQTNIPRFSGLYKEKDTLPKIKSMEIIGLTEMNSSSSSEINNSMTKGVIFKPSQKIPFPPQNQSTKDIINNNSSEFTDDNSNNNTTQNTGENTDIDFLSVFKETMKNIEHEWKEENNITNNSKKNYLRKSTLRNGLLFDEDKVINDSDDEEA